MNLNSIQDFLPDVYDGVLETDALVFAMDSVLDMSKQEVDRALSNQFVMTMDIEAIEAREQQLGIVADPTTENIGFRRLRLLNRYSTSPPFTMCYLKQKLDEIIGVGNWEVFLDYDNYTLYVQTVSVDQNWYHELEFTINSIKPANIVYTNTPHLIHNLLLSETVDWSKYVNNYIMDSWILGQKPFISIVQQGEIVMSNIRSMTDAFLEDVASFVTTDIVDVLINDTITITSFLTKSPDGVTAVIEYDVTPAMVPAINNIKLRGASEKVLTNSSVYIPVTNTVRCKHSIPVMEGTNIQPAATSTMRGAV